MGILLYYTQPIIGAQVGDKQLISLYDSKEKTIRTVSSDRGSVDKFLNEHKKLTQKEEKKALSTIGAFTILGGIAGALITKRFKEAPYSFNVPLCALLGGLLGNIVHRIYLDSNNPFQKLNDKFIANNKE